MLRGVAVCCGGLQCAAGFLGEVLCHMGGVALWHDKKVGRGYSCSCIMHIFL